MEKVKSIIEMEELHNKEIKEINEKNEKNTQSFLDKLKEKLDQKKKACLIW